MHGCVSRWPPPSARTRTPISHRHHHQHHPDHQQHLQKQKTTPVHASTQAKAVAATTSTITVSWSWWRQRRQALDPRWHAARCGASTCGAAAGASDGSRAHARADPARGCGGKLQASYRGVRPRVQCRAATLLRALHVVPLYVLACPSCRRAVGCRADVNVAQGCGLMWRACALGGVVCTWPTDFRRPRPGWLG
jgi:hypothetical protein